MNHSHVMPQQVTIDPTEIARINGLPQGSQPARTTVINENGKTTTISTDKNGKVTITKADAPVAADVAPAPAFVSEEGTPSPPPGFNDVPPQAASIAYAFFLMVAVIVVGWPIARAFGRRIERRGETAALAPAVSDQLLRIEQAVDAMAIEVERISESQRFVAKLQQGSTAERV